MSCWLLSNVLLYLLLAIFSLLLTLSQSLLIQVDPSDSNGSKAIQLSTRYRTYLFMFNGKDFRVSKLLTLSLNIPKTRNLGHFLLFPLLFSVENGGILVFLGLFSISPSLRLLTVSTAKNKNCMKIIRVTNITSSGKSYILMYLRVSFSWTR